MTCVSWVAQASMASSKQGLHLHRLCIASDRVVGLQVGRESATATASATA